MKQEKRLTVKKSHWNFTFVFFTILFGLNAFCSGSSFKSRWDQIFDRLWLGPEYWANPMEDWRVNDGRLECISTGGNRNVHVLTRQLGTAREGFSMSVRLGLREKGQRGSAGFRIGIHDDINDYRGNLLWGKGIDAGMTISGQLIVDGKTMPVKNLPLDDLILTLTAEPTGSDYKLALTVTDPSSDQPLARLATKVAAGRLVGNLAIVNNFQANIKKGSRFWFSDWRIKGDKVEAHNDRVFGPILWAMHTLSNSRGKEGYVLKMTAEMPPLGDQDNNTVELQVQQQNAWKSLGTQTMDPYAHTATFRIPNWPANRNVSYRLVYKMKHRDGIQKAHHWTGTVRKDPHGSYNGYLRADLDSDGWPQSGRNRAIRIIRKCFPLHVCGDQHITTLLQHGIDDQRDSNWSLCTPAIAVGYQRWWRADELGFEYHNRPSHGLPNTGEYIDPLGNKVYVYAVGNPEGSRDQNRYRQAHIRSSGFSIVRIDHQKRTYTCASYRFLADVTDNKNDDLFAGFPYTIQQTDNYGRKPLGYLTEYSYDGVDTPVVKVYDEPSGELVYAIRAKENHFRPWVFHEGIYTVKIGDLDTDTWKTYPGQTIQSKSKAMVKNSVYMANGIKTGEVHQNSAIIWTRLTKHKERNINGLAFTKKAEAVPEGHVLDDMEGSVTGSTGEVHVTYWPEGSQNQARSTSWEAVDPQADFTRQFELSGLRAGTTYKLKVQGRASGATEPSCTLNGSFKTAPDSDVPAPVLFTVVTGQDYHRRDDPLNGHKIYSVMRKLKTDFFIHTGDIEYYDKAMPFAKTPELARFKWNRIYAMPFQRAFHNHTSSYFMKDDHDTLKNDSWPGQTYGKLTWEKGLAIFREQVPMGEKTYRTIRWGRDLQVWLVEGRDFRSPNNMPDGPGKTIWGKEQKQWFFDTVKKSDATFRILISPTPLVGPDRTNKNDNYANKGFTYEGNELREFIGSQKNMCIICGDRHWQYISVDPKTGAREYSCGPTSDLHAGGFSLSMRTPMHRYLRIKGGFLAVSVKRINGKPTITFRHYGPDGKIYNEDKW